MNNVIPRLGTFIICVIICGFIITNSFLENCDFDFKIQVLSVGIFLIWGMILLRAKGWKEYNNRELIVFSICFFLVGVFFCDCFMHRGIVNSPVLAINAEKEGIGRDILAHSAMASGILSCGYPSLLINSDAFYNYHTGSHAIMALVSYVLEIPTFLSYCYIFPMLFYPFFLYLLLTACRLLRRYLRKEEKFHLSDMFFVMCFATYYILPYSWSERMADWKPSWIESESFLIANIFCLVFFCVLFKLLERKYIEKCIWMIKIILIPIFIVLMSVCKISVGGIFTLAVIYYILRKEGRGVKNIILILSYLSILLGVYFIPSVCYAPFYSGSSFSLLNISLFDFLRFYVKPYMWFFHFFVFFGLSALFLAWNIRKDDSVFILIKTKQCVIKECLLLICIAGYLPGCLFSIVGGSAWYFSAIQQLYAVVLLIGYGIPNEFFYKIKQLADRKSMLRKCMAVVIIFIIANSLYTFTRYISRQVQHYNILIEQESRKIGYWDTVTEINKITDNDKKSYYLYIDSDAEIWTRFKNQDSSLYFYPALTGVVCIGMLYYEDGEWYRNDGMIRSKDKLKYLIYNPLTPEKKMTEGQAYQKAKNDKKKAVIYVRKNFEVAVKNVE